MIYMPNAQDPGLAGTLSAYNMLSPDALLPGGGISDNLTADNMAALKGFAPKLGGGGLFGGMTGLEKINLGFNGLSALGGLFLGLKQLGIANKQLNLQRNVANANLANQIQSYNTTLADRSRSRAAVEGQTPAQAQAYVDQNKLAARTL